MLCRQFCIRQCANMKKMRIELGNSEEKLIITYGCSAHYMNLLAQDLCKDGNKTQVLQHITSVIKYFRNHHSPKAWYEAAGGKALVLPIDVRWNTYCDALDSYISNWAILAKISEDYRSDPAFDINIGNIFHYTFYFLYCCF